MTYGHYSSTPYRAKYPAKPRQSTQLGRYPEAASLHARRNRAATYGAEGDEEGVLWTGLVFREVDLKSARAWALFQVVTFIVQWSLWSEVKGHLDLFERTLAAQCSPEHARYGVCLGPMWNLSTFQDFTLEGRGAVWHQGSLVRRSGGHSDMERRRRHRSPMSIEAIDSEIKELQDETAEQVKLLTQRKNQLQAAQGITTTTSVPALPGGTIGTAGAPAALAAHPEDGGNGNASHSFEFTTRSVPPTFLVAIDPVSKAHKLGEVPAEANVSTTDTEELAAAVWSLRVARIDPPQIQKDYYKEHKGTDVVSIEDLSPESQERMTAHGSVKWRATVTNRMASARRWRFVSFVEDSAVPHLSELNARASSASCSFTRAWKAFNQQHQGHSHASLSLCRALLGLFLPVGIGAAYLVYRFVANEQAADSCDCGGFGFHAVVLLKFFMADIPAQICIVLYLLGWYEAEGLRCQLCLFHPAHCDEEHPFHFANTLAFTFTLLSSVANQLLFRPHKAVASALHGKDADRDTDSEEERACVRVSARLVAVCVATLPFTTGVYFATSALLSLPLLMHLLVCVPCATGIQIVQRLWGRLSRAIL